MNKKFNEWYIDMSLCPKDGQLEKRIHTINSNASKMSRDQIITLVRLYFGMPVAESERESIANLFIADDSSFSIRYTEELSVVRVLDPYCDRTLSEAQRWENYYNRFSKDNRWKEYKAEYAQFVLPIILRSENSFSSDFLQFSFSTVHTLLANDEMEYNKWEQLSNLLPEVAWYNSWDKCKRLRKAAKQRSLSIDFSRKNKDGK